MFTQTKFQTVETISREDALILGSLDIIYSDGTSVEDDYYALEIRDKVKYCDEACFTEDLYLFTFSSEDEFSLKMCLRTYSFRYQFEIGLLNEEQLELYYDLLDNLLDEIINEADFSKKYIVNLATSEFTCITH